jgi:hypothetical protein
MRLREHYDGIPGKKVKKLENAPLSAIIKILENSCRLPRLAR